MNFDRYRNFCILISLIRNQNNQNHIWWAIYCIYWGVCLDVWKMKETQTQSHDLIPTSTLACNSKIKNTKKNPQNKMKWNLFKINALARSTLLRCDCVLFRSLFHSKFHIIMKTSSTPTEDRRRKKNGIACVTTCIRVPIESFSRYSI